MFKNKWSLAALAILLFVIFASKGGAMALLPLLRYILPIVVIMLVFKFIKRKLLQATSEVFQQNMGGEPRRNEGDIIDLCPECGEYMKPGHRCSKK